MSVFLLAVSFAGLGIRLLLKSGSRFPETHVSRNKEMQKRGITCARETDIGCSFSENTEGCVICGAKRGQVWD